MKGSYSMGYVSNVIASVTSRKGIVKQKNEDNFYINGKFMDDYETDSVLASIENKSDSFIFSVSNSIDIADKEKGVFISVTKDIKKYHEKPEYKESDLSTRTEQIAGIVSETGKLINSIYSDSEGFSFPSIACLLIKDNKASVISLGNCKAFIIRGGHIKQLSSEWEKTQRLLKLGIITNEQVLDLATRYGIPTENSINEIQKSEEILLEERDLFVLSTSGLMNQIEIEDINEAFKKHNDIETAVNSLVKIAVKSGAEDNITVMAIRIEKITNTYVREPVQSRKTPRKTTPKSIMTLLLIRFIRKIRKFDIRKSYPSVIAFILVIAVIIGGVSLIKSLSGKVASNKDSIENTIQDDEHLSDSTTDDNTNNTETNGNNISEGTTGGTLQNTAENGENGKTLPTKYTVKKGDTLYNISKYFYGDPTKYRIIMEYNNITDPSKIQIGQVLEIPDIYGDSSDN